MCLNKPSQEAEHGISNTGDKTCIKENLDRKNSKLGCLSTVKRLGVKTET